MNQIGYEEVKWKKGLNLKIEKVKNFHETLTRRKGHCQNEQRSKKPKKTMNQIGYEEVKLKIGLIRGLKKWKNVARSEQSSFYFND